MRQYNWVLGYLKLGFTFRYNIICSYEKIQEKKLSDPVSFLILVLATSYLPGRWPAKYFYRYESLRPCSGWERVVYSRLVTSDFFCSESLCFFLTPAPYAGNCTMIISFYAIVNYFSCLGCRFFSSCGVCKQTLTSLSLCFPARHTPVCRHRKHRLPLFRKSPRPISISRLKMLPLLHL